MQNLVYEWVDVSKIFPNLSQIGSNLGPIRKFEGKKIVIFVKILIQIGPIGYMNVSLFVASKLGRGIGLYVLWVHFQIPSDTPTKTKPPIRSHFVVFSHFWAILCPFIHHFWQKISISLLWSCKFTCGLNGALLFVITAIVERMQHGAE